MPGALPGGNVSKTPKDVGGLYTEARRAIQADAFTAAVMACRKLLSHIAVERGAEAGKPFAFYVEHLASSGYIPPNGVAWVDYIRERGNEANHEITLMTKADADAVLTLTENLLRNVYELPALVPGAGKS